MAAELALIWAAVSTTAQAGEDENSIPMQVREGEEIAKSKGWTLAPESPLIVPGHSRNYRDYDKLASDARSVGITAFDKLKEILNANEKHNIKHVIVRDGNRFGRTQSLHAYITEWIIDVGADIYSIYDGYLINKSNYVTWTMNSGYKATSEVKELVNRRYMGLKKSGAKGLPVARPIMTHRIERDVNGKAVKQVVRDEARPLIDAIYKLLTGDYQLILTDFEKKSLKATFNKNYDELTPEDQLLFRTSSFAKIGMRLFEQFAITHPDHGKKLSVSAIHHLLYSAAFWGHSYWIGPIEGMPRRLPGEGKVRRWVYDDTEALPENITVYRDTVEPAYTGEKAERIKRILTFRENLANGGTKKQSYPFSKLIVCGECDHYIVGSSRARTNIATYRFYRCGSYSTGQFSPQTPKCESKFILNEKVIYEFFRRFLAFCSQDIEYIRKWDNFADNEQDLKDLKNQIEKLTDSLNLMASELSSLPQGSLRTALFNKMGAIGNQIDILTARLSAESQSEKVLKIKYVQNKAIELLTEEGVEKILNYPAPELNVFLRDLLGNLRVTWKNKELLIAMPVDKT